MTKRKNKESIDEISQRLLLKQKKSQQKIIANCSSGNRTKKKQK